MAVSFLREVCRQAAPTGVTAGELVPALGTVVEDMGLGLPLRFRPLDPAFSEGQLVRAWDSEELSHVRLTPAGELSIEQLAEFGAWKNVASLHGPLRVSCLVPQPQEPRDCTLLCELAPDRRQVTAISVRPDERYQD